MPLGIVKKEPLSISTSSPNDDTTLSNNGSFLDNHPQIGRFLFGDKSINDSNGNQIPINTPGFNESSLLPDLDIKNKVGSFAYKFLQGLATPSGMIGSSGPKLLSGIKGAEEVPKIEDIQEPFKLNKPTSGKNVVSGRFERKPGSIDINENPPLSISKKLNLGDSSPLEIHSSSNLDGSNVENLKVGKDKNFDPIHEVFNAPKSIEASYDVSAPGRQGFFMASRPEFWKNIPDMFRSLVSQKSSDAIRAGIENNPNYGLALRSKLALTGVTKQPYMREDQFISSLAEKIPGVKQSGRAYTDYLNGLRMDVFSNTIDKLGKIGADFDPRRIADYVNTATGRGSLGKFEKHALGLNEIFFSPRLMASRIKLLNPMLYLTGNGDPVVRQMAVRDLLGYTSAVTGLAALSKAAGAEVELDPRSSDFMKAKVGNQRIDLTGGFGPYVRLIARLATQEYKTGGTTKKLNSNKFGGRTNLDEVENFLTNKMAPIPNLGYTLLKGKDFQGKKIKYTDLEPSFLKEVFGQTVGNNPQAIDEISKRFIPFVAQDIHDVLKNQPDMAPVVIPSSLLGFGSQYYENRKSSPK